MSSLSVVTAGSFTKASRAKLLRILQLTAILTSRKKGSSKEERSLPRARSVSSAMEKKTVALAAAIFLLLLSAEISAARGSRHFGRSTSGHLAGSLRQSGGFRGSFSSRGAHLIPNHHHIPHHHFGNRGHFHHRKSFGLHHRFSPHHIIIPHHGFHSGFFFGPRVISVYPSSAVVWSNPSAMSSYTVPAPENIVDGETVAERPLISLMLRHRDGLGLSRQQVQDLEALRDGYERNAIRYQADIRITEIDLQTLLKADDVDLEQVKVKLQEMEQLKTEMRLARIRAIEQGKGLLSSEQREKFRTLVGNGQYSRLGDEGFTGSVEDQR
jgi:hypothetical protein